MTREEALTKIKTWSLCDDDKEVLAAAIPELKESMSVNMKSFTDIEQSKKLAEILSIESADMCYILHASSDNPDWRFDNDIPPMVLGKTPIKELTVKALPYWSLAALLGVLPFPVLYMEMLGGMILWCCECHFMETDEVVKIEHCNNPIDACYEMIIKLHELNLL